MGKSSVASLLTSVDDLFTTQEERDAAKRETVVDIPLDEISDFPDHPFKVRMDEAMMEMADSIKRYGVLVPGMVRPKEGGGYEMVAGHRRKMGCGLGKCGHCRVGEKYICLDGPVFNYTVSKDMID